MKNLLLAFGAVLGLASAIGFVLQYM